MKLINSKRVLFTASHVATELSPADLEKQKGKPAGALKKAAFLKAINLDNEMLVRIAAAKPDPGIDSAELNRIIKLAKELSAHPEKYLHTAQKLALVSNKDLTTFAKFVDKLFGELILTPIIDAFVAQETISPIGRLYLDRIEMYPIGVERGELVYTVPLAPGETQTISHKEWSVSSREFEQIVQDSFEGYSERGVAEKTDASISTENQAKHSNTLNFGASLSASYGPVAMTTTFGLANSNEQSQSVRQSLSRNREVTEKASARVRQEHKVSVKLETKKGAEDSSFKTISNTATTAMRIDYYRMMRKWRTDLFRYGLRMTYDITIPAPGLRFWTYWKQLDALDTVIATPFAFLLKPADITDANWEQLAADYGAVIDPPMAPDVGVQISRTLEAGKFGEILFEFGFPDGYLATGEASGTITFAGPAGLPNVFIAGESQSQLQMSTIPGTGVMEVKIKDGAQGGQRAAFTILRQPLDYQLTIALTSGAKRRPDLFAAWQIKSWSTLRDAAQARHDQEIGRVRERRDRLYRLLAGKDTLSLRRLEREELLRLMTTWLLGPDSGFSPAPDDVEQTIDQLLENEVDLAGGENLSTFEDLTGAAWLRALAYGETVKFFQQAIEWENLLYFLYPYFWGSDTQAREKFLFEHPDPEHQNFLRAGYARIVVTVRPGFEEDFTKLMETGVLSGPDTSPYIPIAQEIASFAHTNYAGIPPANSELHARPLLYPQQRKTWDKMQVVLAAIEKHFADTGEYPQKLSDLPGPLDTTDAWGYDLEYRIPGSGNDYDLISFGADGQKDGDDLNADLSSAAGASLIATWFDYTPTSGIDIEANTGAATIA